MSGKAQIRKEMIARREALTESERRAAGEAIGTSLLSLGVPQQAVLAGYIAMRGEVNIHESFIAMHDRRVKLCLPTVALPERIMHFRTWVPRTEMRKGPFGTREPAQGEIVTPTVLWTPLVAFDRSGHRLGYGGGYYDATITYLRRASKHVRVIGVGYGFQEVDALPVEKHDMHLDAIVTEKEVIRFS